MHTHAHTYTYIHINSNTSTDTNTDKKKKLSLKPETLHTVVSQKPTSNYLWQIPFLDLEFSHLPGMFPTSHLLHDPE